MGGEEDEAVVLQKVKEGLKKALERALSEQQKLTSEDMALSTREEEIRGVLSNLAAMINEGPTRQARLKEEMVSLEAATQQLGEQLSASDARISALVEEKAKLAIEKKKLSKKEARVTSLQETLATMQEMEEDNRKKASELAAMDELMRGKMEEMQKMQKMMQSMMAQVMAGMGDLDGDQDAEDDEDAAAGQMHSDGAVQYSEAEKQKHMIDELVMKVATMAADLSAAMQETEAKMKELDRQIAEAEGLKEKLTADVQSNARQITTVSTDLENCADPEALAAERVEKEASLESVRAQREEAVARLQEAEQKTLEAERALEGHNTAVATLHSVVHDTHVVMADWEVKMRKHVQKRKRLVALSNTFGVDIQDIRNRYNDEGTHWNEGLKPLIQDAIQQLNSLLEQLEQEPAAS